MLWLMLGSPTAVHAQKAVFAEDFNTYRDGDFLPVCAQKAEPYSIVVFEAAGSKGRIVTGDRSRKTTRHLELSAELKSPGFNVAGYGWKPEKQPRAKEALEEGGEDKRQARKDEAARDLGQYTLSFEIALVSGPGFKDGLGLDVILLGDGNGSGIKLTPDVTGLKAGAGFQKFSIPLKDGQRFLETKTFDPTDSRFKIEFSMVGSVTAATTQKIALDNIALIRERPKDR